MGVPHRSIPPQFARNIPEGLELIVRDGKEYLVVRELLCANGHTLMVESVRIHDEPSIRIAVERPEGTGLVFIDSYWGSHSKLFTFLADSRQPMAYADAYCPHCGVSMTVDRQCGNAHCSSTRGLQFFLPGRENAIYVCARLGCPDHEIATQGVSQSIAREVSNINYSAYSDDEEFGRL